ncbi:unnamed protein product [Spirodela intermedia]|uniref:Uncharacterized protein n=1 Tax=Spirodela intermedia TaxID=51605 RepID=A0A7I8K408_SPIIN|nr:unnamed protein product [Spirodela intermedia]
MWIILSLTKAIYPHLVGHTTAKVACDALAQLFASRAKSRILELHAKLHNTRRGSTSIQELVQNINMITDELVIAGQLINEQELIIIILRGLGPQYAEFTTRITTRIDLLTLEDVLAHLTTHEVIFDFHNVQDNQDPTLYPSANYAQTFTTRGPRHGCYQSDG